MAVPVRIFVSHHHSPVEDEFTARLVADLQNAGAEVWVDSQNIRSNDFVQRINDGLAGRQWLVLVMTPQSLASPWVRSEVNAALNEYTAGRMLGILPIEATPCDVQEIPLLWRTLHRYDATRGYLSIREPVLRALGLTGEANSSRLVASYIESAEQIREYALPKGSKPLYITSGPDGAAWFSEYGTKMIGRLTTHGEFREFSLNLNKSTYGATSSPYGITTGPDGAIWFVDNGTSSLGRMTTDGQLREFPHSGHNGMMCITTGPDRALWFTDRGKNRIGRMTTDGQVREFDLPSGGGPSHITAGPDDALWFTTNNYPSRVTRITTSGQTRVYPRPDTSAPAGICVGPDGALWIAEQSGNKICRMTTSGTTQEYPLPMKGGKPWSVTSGPDGAIWFIARGMGRVGRITIRGEIEILPFSAEEGDLVDIVAGSDGAVWFTDAKADKIRRIAV